MAADTKAHPIDTLRELVTALEAAITVALAKPKPKAVHHLRTITRRIEAQLELLVLLPGVPKHAKPAERSRKLLGKLRKTAGRVRDLDVQRDLADSKSPGLQKDAQHLRKLFKRQRKEEADRLLGIIGKHQDKLVRALEALLKALDSGEPYSLSTPQLMQLTCDWYTHNVLAVAQSSEQMHAVRKTAKLARYMAESAPEVAQSVHKLARAFESLQQAGGHWHDWFTLSEIARRELGDSSPLTQSFVRRCEKSLTDYQRRLKVFPKKIRAIASATAG
jgi:CHAD domain-containing protein